MKNYVSLIALILVISCSTNQDKGYQLGELTLEVNGSPDALAVFEKAYLQLHSFEYDDAAEGFVEAQKIDPDFAMAYWGEAMTYNHSIWQEQDYEKGRNALQKLGNTPEARISKAQSELEKDFIRAIEILYGEGTKTSRDKRYADFMGELYKKYPKNHEVASFYALALLGSVPAGRDDRVYQASARVSEKILKENPKHPGALHYFIHANDDPYHAATALFAADDYAVVAPDAAHALHMPTHIYVAMGMWKEVVTSNEVSWAASYNRKERKQLTNNALGYHSFHWLQYGYLQQGRREEAKKMLADMKAYCAELPSSRARTHEIFLKSTYLVETNDWKSEWSSLETDAKDLNIVVRSMESFVKGMKYFHLNDAEALNSVIQLMEKDRQIEQATISDEGIAICGGGGARRENATQVDIDISKIIETELRIAHSMLLKDLILAEKLFKEVTSMEENTSYTYGPPDIVKPTYEWYGEFLLEQNRPEDALIQFNKSLERAPKRLLSLKGKLKAAEILKDESLVKEVMKELKDVEEYKQSSYVRPS